MIFHFTSGLENEGLFTNRMNGKHYVLGKLDKSTGYLIVGEEHWV